MLDAEMPAPTGEDITNLLQAWCAGNQGALDQLIPIVHGELHRLASRYMAAERPDGTLQTTALVNELYLRLVDIRRMAWKDRTHFFAVCSQLMRRVLVDLARSRKSLKRGGHTVQVPMDEHMATCRETAVDLIALDSALDRLTAFDARKSRIVEMRFFAGLSVEETAAVLDVSVETVLRDWRLAKVWLFRELGGDSSDGS
jgi:RNA polymerase sigma factor (TIGR02999 family)